MLNRRNKNLRVVDPQDDPTDKIIEDIMKELNGEEVSIEEMEERIRQYKRKTRRKIGIGIVAVLAVAISIFLVIQLQTYTTARVSDSYKITGASDSSYEQFAEGVLKYSRDGIVYLNKKGDEVWNQSYQIKNPFLHVNGESGAVADKGGNDILVFQKDGMKGEIHTNLPIEKMTLSEQGIVGVILKNESSPQIICYDLAGNVLVEQKTSISGKGYPVDLALSPDGELLQVLYLDVQKAKISSGIAYYNFGTAGENKEDHQVFYKEEADTVTASGFFMDQNTSAVISDHSLLLYRGKEVPEAKTRITVEKEIQSVFHNDKYIGMILKNEGKEGYELQLYNASGKRVLSKDFTGAYKNAKICGSQVILYDGKNCSIFLRSGIQKFEGELEYNILEMFPIAGVNKYIVMNANGMENVRLVK